MSRERIRNHPGHASQKSHGRKGGMSEEEFDSQFGSAMSGRAAMAATDRADMADDTAWMVSRYAGNGLAVNSELRASRGQAAEGSGTTKGIAKGVDRAMQGQELKQDIAVTRGIQDVQATFGGRDPVAGMEFVDHGFVSTSMDSIPKDTFVGESSGAYVRVLARAGVRAISAPSLDHDEILLDRGLTFRVVGAQPPAYDGAPWRIDVEALP